MTRLEVGLEIEQTIVNAGRACVGSNVRLGLDGARAHACTHMRRRRRRSLLSLYLYATAALVAPTSGSSSQREKPASAVQPLKSCRRVLSGGAESARV